MIHFVKAIGVALYSAGCGRVYPRCEIIAGGSEDNQDRQAGARRQRSPSTGPSDDRIRTYQVYLVRERGLAPSSVEIVVCAVCPDLYMAGAENRDPAGVYVPLAQNPPRPIGLAARVPGDPLTLAAPLRAQARVMDPDLPIYATQTLQRAVDDSMWAYPCSAPCSC